MKGSPGGLRDIQMIGWLAQRHLGTRTLDELVPHKFLTAGQLLLYADPFGPFLVREFDQADGDYTISYTGTGQAGVYYILVFAPGHTPGNGDYTLTLQQSGS